VAEVAMAQGGDSGCPRHVMMFRGGGGGGYPRRQHPEEVAAAAGALGGAAVAADLGERASVMWVHGHATRG
jgi:hypothetical protein